MELPNKKYDVIYADPPWSFKVWSKDTGSGRSAEAHYTTMNLEAIKALPIADLAKPDCVLFLWAVGPQIPEALEVMKAWGFKFKTIGFTWMKATKQGKPFMGMGYWTRANAEICLLGTRGKPKRKARNVPQAVFEPLREHSRKPDCVPARIEALIEGTDRIELFARTSREGWDSWGNQTEKFPAILKGPST